MFVGSARKKSRKKDVKLLKSEKVRTLVNGELAAAYHNVVWNGRDDRGRNFGSGVFFYRMKTEDDNDVKKMLMIK